MQELQIEIQELQIEIQELQMLRISICHVFVLRRVYLFETAILIHCIGLKNSRRPAAFSQGSSSQTFVPNRRVDTEFMVVRASPTCKLSNSQPKRHEEGLLKKKYIQRFTGQQANKVYKITTSKENTCKNLARI